MDKRNQIFGFLTPTWRKYLEVRVHFAGLAIGVILLIYVVVAVVGLNKISGVLDTLDSHRINQEKLVLMLEEKIVRGLK